MSGSLGLFQNREWLEVKSVVLPAGAASIKAPGLKGLAASGLMNA